MPVEDIPAAKALEQRRRNARAKWPGRGEAGAHFAPIALPAFTPRNQLAKSDRIFCIGSCFAREIEAVLERLGYQVLSRPVRDAQTGMIDLNKYTVPSILNELRHAYNPGQFPADDFLVEAPDGTTSDYQLTGGLRQRGALAAKAMRDAASAHFARIQQADFVVLTLGYSEVWHDRSTGLDLNRAPSRALIEAAPERFTLRVLSAEENATALRAVLSLLAEHMPNGPRAILTVSPVPLQSTFRNCDVMLANTYSKAALRCAVDAVCADYPWVDYFPSFEMATLSDPALVWSDDDYRHLNRDFVTMIMCHVLDGLIPETERVHAREQRIAQARLLSRLAAPAGHGRWRRLEAWVMHRLLGGARLRKYNRDRAAFFEDSRSRLARIYWRLTR